MKLLVMLGMSIVVLSLSGCTAGKLSAKVCHDLGYLKLVPVIDPAKLDSIAKNYCSGVDVGVNAAATPGQAPVQ